MKPIYAIILSLLIPSVAFSQAIINNPEKISGTKLVELIIKGEFYMGHNGGDCDSEESRLDCIALNAGGSGFQELMLKSTDEKLKICYALNILNRNISSYERYLSKVKDGTAKVDPDDPLPQWEYEMCIKQRRLVVKYLRQLSIKQAN
jgi:hypothetical protein